MHSKLRGKIIEQYGSLKNFAEVLGTKPQSVTATLRAKTMKIDTAKRWAMALGIQAKDWEQYFF